MTERAVSLLDDAVLDRAWVVSNVLGGMCAGFGLRGARISAFLLDRVSLQRTIVILNIHPIFSTIIILSGWAAKTLSAWVG